VDFDNKANSIVQLIKEVHPFINSKNIDNKTCIFIVHISRSFTFKSGFILKELIVNRCAVSVAGSVHSEAGSATLVIFK